MQNGTWRQIDTQGEDLVTLQDDYGSIASISVDDGCFLLTVNGKPSAWWFPEAVDALLFFSFISFTKVAKVKMMENLKFVYRHEIWVEASSAEEAERKAVAIAWKKLNLKQVKVEGYSIASPKRYYLVTLTSPLATPKDGVAITDAEGIEPTLDCLEGSYLVH